MHWTVAIVQRTPPQQLSHVACVSVEAITLQCLLYGCLFRGRCLATGLHATVHITNPVETLHLS
jgi:hypothetical protein